MKPHPLIVGIGGFVGACLVAWKLWYLFQHKQKAD
jgi:hypothetical protein